MRRREFRPRAASGSSLLPRRPGRPGLRPRGAGRGRKLRSRVLIAGAVILAAAAAWVGVQLLRPVPPMVLEASVTTVRVLPGAAPRPEWPGRAQAAIGLPGAGLLGVHGGSRPVPVASLAKIMAGYIVLGDHPLPAGGSGPVITVTAADAAAYASDQRQGQSVVRVVRGEQLTERQALQAMLIPSGNNIASLLARWDAGSQAAFVAKMNAAARSLGLRSTRYADASGADPATVSTAADQFWLTVRAMEIPAFRQIVAMPQVTLPAADLAYNINAALGHAGIVGVKTGSSSQAGGCLAFAATRTVAGRAVMIVGVVLGVRAQPRAARAAIGHFGASTGAAAALWAAAEPGASIAAVVSRSGRPDLARPPAGRGDRAGTADRRRA